VLIAAARRLVSFCRPAPFTVERFYSKWLYPILQANLTSLSNRSPIALFDVAIVVFILIAIGIWTWSIRLARKKQAIRSLWRGFVATLTLLAVVYLWFLASWGLNYARPPLESTMTLRRVADYAGSRARLAEHSIDRANATHAAGHAAAFPAINDSPQALVDALHQVEKGLGRPRPTVIATPKWSVFSPFYRASA
jgi:uncharacterized iron-regulated membrane protein